MTILSKYSLDSLPIGNNRGALATYCDDIRQEMSGKHTLIGVYGDSLIVTSFPALLPQLSIWVSTWTNHGNPFSKLVFRILRDDELLSEEVWDVAGALNAWVLETERKKSRNLVDPNARMRILRTVRISPFVIEQEGSLRVRIETESEELRAGGLALRLDPAASENESQSD